MEIASENADLKEVNEQMMDINLVGLLINQLKAIFQVSSKIKLIGYLRVGAIEICKYISFWYGDC